MNIKVDRSLPRNVLTDADVSLAVDTMSDTFEYLETDVPSDLTLRLSRASDFRPVHPGIGAYTDSSGNVRLFIPTNKNPKNYQPKSRSALLNIMGSHEGLHSVRAIRGLDNINHEAGLILAEGLASHFQGKAEVAYGFIDDTQLPYKVSPAGEMLTDTFVNAVLSTDDSRRRKHVSRHGVYAVGYHAVCRVIGDHMSTTPADYLHSLDDFIQLMNQAAYEPAA